MKLDNEIINPVYEKVETKLADDKVIINSIPAKIKELKTIIQSKNENIDKAGKNNRKK